MNNLLIFFLLLSTTIKSQILIDLNKPLNIQQLKFGSNIKDYPWLNKDEITDAFEIKSDRHQLFNIPYVATVATNDSGFVNQFSVSYDTLNAFKISDILTKIYGCSFYTNKYSRIWIGKEVELVEYFNLGLFCYYPSNINLVKRYYKLKRREQHLSKTCSLKGKHKKNQESTQLEIHNLEKDIVRKFPVHNTLIGYRIERGNKHWNIGVFNTDVETVNIIKHDPIN